MVESAPSPEAQAVPSQGDVFISYSRTDRDIASRLTEFLKSRGRSAWVDFADIPPSAEWMAEIREAIDASDTFVVLLSPDSVASKICSEELEHAISGNKRVVPLVVRDVSPEDVPLEVAKLNWLFLREQDDFDRGADQLIETLETDLDAVRFHTRLLVKARDWGQAGQPPGRLLRGADLTEAERWISSPDRHLPPTELQSRFVAASRKGASKRQRSAIALSTAVAVVAASLGVYAWTQRGAAIDQRRAAERQAAVANSRGLAIQATSAMDEQLALGTLLSIEAHRVAPTPESTDAIHVAAQTTAWIDRVMRGRRGVVRSTAFSPDGTTLASGNADGTVVLWDLATGRQIGQPLEADPKQISSVAFSPDGRVLASGGTAGGVTLWDPTTGSRSGALEGPKGDITALAFAANGRTLAAGVADGTIWLWDVESGKPIGKPLVAHDGRVKAVVFLAGGRKLASASIRATEYNCGQATAAVWNPRSGEEIGRPIKGVSNACSVALSADGKVFASGGLAGDVLMRNVIPGERIRISIRAPDLVRLAFAPNGRILATGTRDAVVQLWDAKTGDPFGGHLVGQENEVSSLVFSPDGDMLASGGQTGSVVLWNSPGFHHPGPCFDGAVVEFSPDDSVVAAALCALTIFDRATGEWIRGSPENPGMGPWTLAFSPSGELLATGNQDGSITLWDPTTADPVMDPLRGHLRGLVEVAFSPDGKILASGSSDAAVTLWDPSTGEQLGEPLRGHKGPVYALDFSPDGTTVASGGRDSTVILWDVRTSQPIGSPLQAGGEAWDVAFSPDGSMIASGNGDGSITVWDVESGDMIGQPLRGHTAGIPSLDFSPDGQTLASASLDGTIDLWDVQTWKLIGDPQPAFGNPWGLDFSTSGTLLASGGDGGSVYVRSAAAWTSDIAALEERLCRVAGRNLTPAEWDRYLPFTSYRRTCPNLPIPTDSSASG